MRLRHFETLRPVCPKCTAGGARFPLNVGSVSRECSSDIHEGVLVCSNALCQGEYPIIDGIPIIVRDVREFVAANILSINGRDDLTETSESLIGDCCGPASNYDVRRQHLSSYAWDHYAEFDPAEPASECVDGRPGGVVRLLRQGMDLCGEVRRGPIIDLGCGPGRTCFALAETSDELVLGVDLNHALLRLASQVLREGRVVYPRRRVGLAYDRREFVVPTRNAENVDFWACDAAALPFAERTFSLATAMNVLDSVADPTALLSSIATQIAAKGSAIIACPYDWSAAVTDPSSWLGGHSQRSELRGDSAATLRWHLNHYSLQIVAELDHLPWHVRLHERSKMRYDVHLVVVRAKP